MIMKFLMNSTFVVNAIKDSILIGSLGNASLVKSMFICVMNASKMSSKMRKRYTVQVVQED